MFVCCVQDGEKIHMQCPIVGYAYTHIVQVHLSLCLCSVAAIRAKKSCPKIITGFLYHLNSHLSAHRRATGNGEKLRIRQTSGTITTSVTTGLSSSADAAQGDAGVGGGAAPSSGAASSATGVKQRDDDESGDENATIAASATSAIGAGSVDDATNWIGGGGGGGTSDATKTVAVGGGGGGGGESVGGATTFDDAKLAAALASAETG